MVVFLHKPRLMIVGTGSGVGKTTICCSLLKALTQQGYKVSAFKSGPDYIDPMFHTEVLGISSRNLDLFMLSEQTVPYLLKEHTKDTDIAMIEGAMGFYDGIGSTSKASAYHLSVVTKTPVVLVISCKGMARSVAALVKGYLALEPNSIQGVILNHVTEAMARFYQAIIEEETGVKVVGYFPPMPVCTLGSRHLGLVTPDSMTNLQEMLQLLAEQAQATMDVEGLIKIAKSAPPLWVEEPQITSVKEKIRIGIARDEAFNFYYEDSLNLLERLGAKLVPFSPIKDGKLPSELDGLLIGGGYPELHREALEKNKTLRGEIKKQLEKGMPCIAECGGFMYLQRQLLDDKNNPYEMVGYLPGSAWMTSKLNRFGYIYLIPKEDSMLFRAGECIPAHEFHYSDSDANGSALEALKPMKNRSWGCGMTTETLYAGYPHLHLWSNVKLAKRYVEACVCFKSKRVGE